MSVSAHSARNQAYSRQEGRCFYCKSKMWSAHSEVFASLHNLTRNQARLFQCTAEHVVARQDGGNHSQSNIVAVCRFCNLWRHRRRKPPSSTEFLNIVQKRLYARRCHIEASAYSLTLWARTHGRRRLTGIASSSRTAPGNDVQRRSS